MNKKHLLLPLLFITIAGCQKEIQVEEKIVYKDSAELELLEVKQKLLSSYIKFDPSTVEGVPQIVDLRPFQSSIKNQASRGSCTFFATAAIAEGVIKKDMGIEVNISEEYLIQQTKVKNHISTFSEGTSNLWTANIPAIISQGFAFEYAAPHNTTATSYTQPCYGIPKDQRSAGCLSNPFLKVEEKDIIKETNLVPKRFSFDYEKESPVEVVVNAFAETQSPILFSIYVHPDSANRKTGEYKMTSEMELECTVGKVKCGGHAMALVGYDLEKRIFLLKNSYSPDWGNNGFGFISFADFPRLIMYGDFVTLELESSINFSDGMLQKKRETSFTLNDFKVENRRDITTRSIHHQFDSNGFWLDPFLKDELVETKRSKKINHEMTVLTISGSFKNTYNTSASIYATVCAIKDEVLPPSDDNCEFVKWINQDGTFATYPTSSRNSYFFSGKDKEIDISKGGKFSTEFPFYKSDLSPEQVEGKMLFFKLNVYQYNDQGDPDIANEFIPFELN